MDHPAPDRSIFQTVDYWHFGRSSADEPTHKEWSHFCVMAPGFDLLVNFSLVGNRLGVPTIPRFTALYSDEEGCWDGDMDTYGAESASVIRGRTDVSIGANRLELSPEGYRIAFALRDRPLSGDLRLTPVTRPIIADNVRLSAMENVRWLVVPHLLADGVLEAGGVRHDLRAAPAYHDRNWGNFSWGGDYSWEWATIVPVEPDGGWSLVYSRIADRGRARTLAKSLLLYRGEFPARKFFARDLTIRQEGLLRPKRVLQVPRIMSLLLNSAEIDIPERMSIRVDGFGAEIDVEIRFDGYGQIGVPNDHGLGVTTLSEVAGTARVDGWVGAERICFDGRIQAEFNNAEP